jgi:hypothetical protein
MKKSFRERFSSRHVVLPVIHVATEALALRNATIARESGQIHVVTRSDFETFAREFEKRF